MPAAKLVAEKFEIMLRASETLAVDRLSAQEIRVHVGQGEIIKINESIFVPFTPRGHVERVLIKTERLDELARVSLTLSLNTNWPVRF